MKKSGALSWIVRLALVVVIAGCTWGAAGTTEAKADPSGGYTLNSSTNDLLGAHNARMLVVFGPTVAFKRYMAVGLLSQSMTIATDVSGGVRYELKESGRDRILTIQ